MMRNLPWDPVRDLAPVGMATVAPHGIFTAPGLPPNTLPAFIAYAKERPGRINYASSGSGSIQHIAGVLFSRAVGVPMIHVPYRGAGQAWQDVVGGRVELFITTPSSAVGLVRGGQAKALAIASETRSSALPEVPTTAEAGLPGFEMDAWFAFFAPAGTPPEFVSRINAALREATTQPDLRRRAEEGGVILRPADGRRDGRGGAARDRDPGPHHPGEWHHARIVNRGASTGSRSRRACGRRPARSQARAPPPASRDRGRAARQARPRASAR